MVSIPFRYKVYIFVVYSIHIRKMKTKYLYQEKWSLYLNWMKPKKYRRQDRRVVPHLYYFDIENDFWAYKIKQANISFLVWLWNSKVHAVKVAHIFLINMKSGVLITFCHQSSARVVKVVKCIDPINDLDLNFFDFVNAGVKLTIFY